VDRFDRIAHPELKPSRMLSLTGYGVNISSLDSAISTLEA
jgi:hypothetical protein